MPALFACLGVLFLLFINIRLPKPVFAAAAGTVNFQARLQTASGAIVADGFYNVEFKLYDASSGGSALWTEDYLVVDGQGLKAVDGYISTPLGTIVPFPSTIDWSQQLYLTMNIGGTGSGVNASNIDPSDWDGEMSPRLALTASTYAFQAGSAAQAGALSVASGSNTATLSIQAPTSGNQTFVIQDQGATGTYDLLTTQSADNSFVQLQSGTPTQQTGKLDISGAATVGNITTTSLDTASAAAISIGGANANAINLGNTTSNIATTINGTAVVRPTSGHDSTTAFQVQNASGSSVLSVDTTNSIVGTAATSAASTNSNALVLQSGSASGATSNSGNVTLDSGTATGTAGVVNLGTAATPTVNVGSTGSTAKGTAVHIGDTSSASNAQTVVIGSIAANTGNTTIIQGGNGSGAVGIQASAGGTINIATSNNNTLNIGTTTTTGQITIGGVHETGQLVLGQSDTTNTISIGNSVSSGNTQTVTIGTSGSGTSILYIGSSSSSVNNLVDLQAGATNFYVNPTYTQQSATGITETVSGSATAPSDIIKTTTNSIAAFQVQNATGTGLLTVDTSGNNIVLGKASSATGNLQLANTSNAYLVTITSSSSTAGNYTLTLPTDGATGTQCLQSTSGSTSTTTALQFGSCSGGSYINNGTALQSGNMNVQAATGSVAAKLEAASSSPGDILDLLNNGAATTASFGPTGAVLFKTSTDSATAFQVQNHSSATSVLDVDTTNGRVGINMNNPAYALDVNGVINSNTSVDVNGVAVCTTACVPSGGSGNYIQNATAVQTSANFFIRSASTSAPVGIMQGASGQTADLLDLQTWNGTSAATVASFNAGGDLSVADNALTTGTAVNIATTSALQTAGSLLNVSDTATLSTSGGSDAASLVNISRSLTANISGTPAPLPDTTGTGPHSYNQTTAVTTWSTSYTVSASHSNNFLLVEVYIPQSCAFPPITSVTYNTTQTMTLIGSGAGSGAECVYFYGLTAPVTGGSTLAVNTSSNSTMTVNVSDWYNVSQSAPYNTSGNGAFTSTTGFTSTPSLSASSVPGQVIVDAMYSFAKNSTTPAQGGSQTFLSSITDPTTNQIQFADSYASAAGSGNATTMGWSNVAEFGSSYLTGDASIGLNRSSSETVSSAVASISNNCSITAGSCTDASNVLSLTQSYSGATGAVLNITDTGSGDMLDLISGSTNVSKITSTGAVTFENASNSLNAFRIQNSSGANVFTVDTTDNEVIIGAGATGESTAKLLVLDSGNTNTDPTEVDGGMYYNSSLGQFRCGQGGVWVSCIALNNASTGNQTVTTTTTAYLTGSAISVPPGGLHVGTQFIWRIAMTKSASGTTAPTFLVKYGTNGSTADTTEITLNGPAETGVADTAFWTIMVTVQSVNSSGTWQGSMSMTHNLAATGFSSVGGSAAAQAVSGTFNDTTANAIVGIACTAGASNTFTVQQVQTQTVGL